MIKILFICHGNICRSPIAKYVLQNMVNKATLADQFYIDSAATSTEEIGNPIYPPARRTLSKYGISCEGHAATQMTRRDYETYDYIIGMEQYNIRNMLRITGGDPGGKFSLLRDYTDQPGDIADPWYTGDFETTYRQITDGCQGLLEHLGFK